VPSPPRTALTTEDKRGQEAGRSSPADKHNERASALKSYRRSRGLCFICGEKWAPGHQCAPTVQLHIVQELIDALGFDLLEGRDSEPAATAEMLAISSAAMTGTEAPSTFRLVGQLQKQKVLMLVDSGSSHCFVNEDTAGYLDSSATFASENC
jgi:hypothetical protein